MTGQQFIEMLRKRGWKCEQATGSSEVALAPQLPLELRQFLASYRILSNAEETMWFWSEADYLRDPESAAGFSLNTLEELSVEACSGDPAWLEEVRRFWRSHTPLMMSVNGEYEFLAYCHTGSESGSYVHGREPEFEDVEKVASSLPDLFEWFLNRVA